MRATVLPVITGYIFSATNRTNLCTSNVDRDDLSALVCGLLLLGLYVSERGDSIVSATWGAVLGAFCGSFFLAVVVFRSYAETYSSLRKFLAARQSFYLELKGQIDSTPAFDVFVYNPRMNVPLVNCSTGCAETPN